MDNNLNLLENIKDNKNYIENYYNKLIQWNNFLYQDFKVIRSIKIILDLKEIINNFILLNEYSILFYIDNKLIKISSKNNNYQKIKDKNIIDELNNICNNYKCNNINLLEEEGYTNLNSIFNDFKYNYFKIFDDFIYSENNLEKIMIIIHSDEKDVKLYNNLFNIKYQNYFKILLRVIEINFYNKLNINIYKIGIFKIIYYDILRIITENLDLLIFIRFLSLTNNIKLVDKYDENNKEISFFFENKNLYFFNTKNDFLLNYEISNIFKETLLNINNVLKILDIFNQYENNDTYLYYYNMDNILIYNNRINNDFFTYGYDKNKNWNIEKKNSFYNFSTLNEDYINLKKNCKNNLIYSKILNLINKCIKENSNIYEIDDYITIQINYNTNRLYRGYFIIINDNAKKKKDKDFWKDLTFCLEPINNKINLISIESIGNLDDSYEDKKIIWNNQKTVVNTILEEYIPNKYKINNNSIVSFNNIVKQITKTDKMLINYKDKIIDQKFNLNNLKENLNKIPKILILNKEENSFKKELLYNWNLNIFEYNELKLINIVFVIFKSHNLFKRYNIKDKTLFNFIWKCKYFYTKNNNLYHNFKHCISVTHGVNYLLKFNKIKEYLNELELPVLVAAIGHDWDHGGLTNNYLINSKSELSIIYHGVSPLEQHHCYILFSILQFNDNNILKNVNEIDINYFKKIIIKCILSTDMQNHFENLKTLKDKILNKDLENNAKNKLDIAEFIVHLSDLQGPSKNLEISISWSKLVNKEFSHQYNLELNNNLIITPYFKDLDNPKVYHKNEYNFMNFIIKPLYELMNIFLEEEEFEEIYEQVNNNINFHKIGFN